ncbi:nucleolar complex-associated protein 3 [Cornus florida]|uniref:nucleolar complex-associated protein 3 n=1 Tax=Cornus florida TaxID=4283 RepID=UPI0028991B4E|nr:nucleolar complex-associated protein 3 [Cornus florida]XP_059661856.1 nucleolar complex-associated protein 3 [Cornus florida]XP_059661857.1 nucleolar complex-associated protein 3 [Cornus florida]
MGKKNKIVLPPELPPDISEDEIEVSDEDLQFVNENRDYAGFVSKLDTQSITKHVKRVADVKEDALESLYEKRSRKKSVEKEREDKGLEVDPVDALPVKTLDGKLYYRTVSKTSKIAPSESENEADGDNGDKSVVKLTKAEKWAKLKKMRKEAKQQEKLVTEEDEVQQQTPQAEVLAEVKKELSAEEANEGKKYRLAELGTTLLTDPESNIKSLREMLQLSKDGDHAIVALGLKSLLAVFRDIIPGYKIRLPTEKEQEMVVSKAVKKMRYYESTLLSAYKAYLQRLIALEQQASFHRVSVRCMCTLLDAVPHFNFRENLLAAVIKNISSQDDVVRKLCCATVKSLFTNEGKHGGEATIEAVRLIADHVKSHDCQLHPDSLEVFLSLSFDEDIGRPETSKVDNKHKYKKNKKRKNFEEPSQMQGNDRKKSRKELMSKTREEVNADFKAASITQDAMERRRIQSETLSAVFGTYFRILKRTMQPIADRSEWGVNSIPGASGCHPLLAPCLDGIGKFSHLIDLDFMGDLLNYLRKLAGGGSNLDGSSENSLKHLTVSERLRCCIVAFKVMRSNLDALNVDLQDFFVQLYTLILEYRPGRDQGEVLAEALKIMLCDNRQHDMQRAAAFIKRLATFSLCFGSAESMAALVTLKHLLQKNVKCRNLLENDDGGGSISGPIARYQPYASDPNLSGALASVLWELNLLTKHYHPAVSTMASVISTMSADHDQIYRSTVSPQQAFVESSLERESFNPKIDTRKLTHKRKRGGASSIPAGIGSHPDKMSQIDEDVVRKKLSEHFSLLRDISENERLRAELDHTKLSLDLYKQYKNQRKTKQINKKMINY